MLFALNEPFYTGPASFSFVVVIFIRNCVFGLSYARLSRKALALQIYSLPMNTNNRGKSANVHSIDNMLHATATTHVHYK